MAGDDDSEKSHEATEHKLDEARKRGELPRSTDLMTAGAYGGLTLALAAGGSSTLEVMGTTLQTLLARPDQLAPRVFGTDPSGAFFGPLLARTAMGLWPWFILPAAVTLLAVVAQRAMVFAPEKLEPKLSRLDPVQNAKQKYGPSGLFEFAKNLAKVLLFSVVLGAFLMLRLPALLGILNGSAASVGTVLVRVTAEFLLVVLVISLTVGAGDYLWQRFDHLRRNRMSQQEVRDEHKQNEGDPQMKQQRQQRGRQIVSDRMMADVPTADVVIVNPTHYAVALKWARTPGSAPVCVAKGQDAVALRIRDIALENGVPVRSDPPTARALHATTRIGDEIDPTHYHAVAAAIRFADTIRRKARARG